MVGDFFMVHPYFKRSQHYSPKVSTKPLGTLGISVVIPSYNEPNLWKSLESLMNCQLPQSAVEVLVVINYPEGSPSYVVENANECIKIVNQANDQKRNAAFQIIPINASNLPKKHAGVGLARKIGMDEAAWRLSQAENELKIIACFDADATCSENYLVELEKLWRSYSETEACSIRYAHPTEGDEFDQKIYNGITQYELHLRYYIQAGKYVGHPFSYHTIGSSMACSADAYMRYGGMNKNKAGEDFYFLQKIIPHGKFRELNGCCIYPSPRPSYRVPFGTGRAMTKFMENSEDNYLTYNLFSWLALKPFLDDSKQLYGANNNAAENYLLEQEQGLQAFLRINNFIKAIEEVNANTSTPESFQKRFFQWFDAFMLLKYLNYASENHFSKVPITQEAYKLTLLTGIPLLSNSLTDINLLFSYRTWEKLSYSIQP
jgi:glycosyltransferase involved in cell wall biosynthesis